MKVTPISDRLLIKPDEPKKEAAGLTLIKTDKPNQGKVVKIGKGVKEVKVGHQVTFQRERFTELKVDGEVICLGKEEDVHWREA